MRLLILAGLFVSLPCLACVNAYDLEYSHHSRMLTADKWWKSREDVGVVAFAMIPLILILLVIRFIWRSVKKLRAAGPPKIQGKIR